MNCSEFQEIKELYIAGECSLAQRAAIEEHLKQCQECRGSVDDLKHIVSLLEQTFNQIRPPVEFKEKLIDRFIKPPVRLYVTRRPWLRMSIAAASLLILGLGIVWILRAKAPGINQIELREGVKVRFADGVHFKILSPQRLCLLEGKLWIHVNKKLSVKPLVIETPQGVATAMGTELIIDVVATGVKRSVNIYVFEGAVKFAARDRRELIFPGQYLCSTGTRLRVEKMPPYAEELRRSLVHGATDRILLGSNKGIYLIEIKGEVLEPLAPGVACGRISCSPDGQKAVFESQIDGRKPELFMLDLFTMVITQLTFNDFYDGQPSWSPDGSHIAFVSDQEGQRQIYLLNLSGDTTIEEKDLIRLTYTDTEKGSPTWSPDGEMIAFTTYDKTNGKAGIWLQHLGGLKPVMLTGSSNLSFHDLSWSPDGTHLAFIVQTAQGSQVCTLDLGGTQLILHTEAGRYYSPIWHPAGSMLFYLKDYEDRSILCTRDLQKGGSKRVYLPRRFTTLAGRIGG
jgi:hypothetical protein